jgi:hypothetical protein
MINSVTFAGLFRAANKEAIMTRLIAATVLVCSFGLATPNGLVAVPDRDCMRIEGPLVISWDIQSTDKLAPQIEIYDETARSVAKVNVLRYVPEATLVHIADVSTLPQELIAVSAIFSRGKGIQPAASLLYLDWQGNLLSAVALAPSREALRLAVDDQGNVWTLTTHSDGLPPAQAPMVVKYDRKGREVRTVLNRAEFPSDAELTVEDPTVGIVGFGFSSGHVWMWLPSATELVTIQTATGTVDSRTRTGLPSGSSRRVFWQSPGTVVAEVVTTKDSVRSPALYRWSTQQPTWRAVVGSDCPKHPRLVGVANDRVVFTDPTLPDIRELCATPVAAN